MMPGVRTRAHADGERPAWRPFRGATAVMFALAALIGAGGLWACYELGKIGKPPPHPSPGAIGFSPLTQTERESIPAARKARAERDDARRRRSKARKARDRTRTAYRDALRTGIVPPAVEMRHLAARERVVLADRRFARAEERLETTKRNARAAHDVIDAAWREQARELRADRRAHDRLTLVLRLAFAAAIVATGYWWGSRPAVAWSRFAIVPPGLVGAGVLIALGVSAAYAGTLVEPPTRDAALPYLALAAITLAVAAFSRFRPRRAA